MEKEIKMALIIGLLMLILGIVGIIYSYPKIDSIPDVNKIHYVKDNRTSLCFAINHEYGMERVSCEKVEHLLTK